MNVLVGASIYGRPGRKAPGQGPHGIRKEVMLTPMCKITLPQSGNHSTDIRPVMLLTEEERKAEDFLILGVAEGYGEACEVVRTMVDDMYRHTDGFNWKSIWRTWGRQDDSYSARDIEEARVLFFCSSWGCCLAFSWQCCSSL